MILFWKKQFYVYHVALVFISDSFLKKIFLHTLRMNDHARYVKDNLCTCHDHSCIIYVKLPNGAMTKYLEYSSISSCTTRHYVFCGTKNSRQKTNSTKTYVITRWYLQSGKLIKKSNWLLILDCNCSTKNQLKLLCMPAKKSIGYAIGVK